jgi:hypothetical protein
MGRAERNPAVYEQLLEVPDYLVAEIVRGALVTKRRPAAERYG